MNDESITHNANHLTLQVIFLWDVIDYHILALLLARRILSCCVQLQLAIYK
jgi:hypothetical protein